MYKNKFADNCNGLNLNTDLSTFCLMVLLYSFKQHTHMHTHTYEDTYIHIYLASVYVHNINTFYIYKYIVCAHTFNITPYDIKCMFFFSESKDQSCVKDNRTIQFFSWLLENEEGES